MPSEPTGTAQSPEAIYNSIGDGYALQRRADPRIAQSILLALGSSQSVINVGAGAGSYEPSDRRVLAIEPSELMISQRPAGSAPCVLGTAESLPARDGAFDAAMAVLTIHHWRDWKQGLREMRRVARSKIVLVTFDVEACDFWLTRDYFPDLLVADRELMPKLRHLQDELGPAEILPLMVPHDCVDGFVGAYWRRPAMYLDPAVRRSMSTFTRIDTSAGLKRLAGDLEDGTWARRNRALVDRDALDVGYRVIRWTFE